MKIWHKKNREFRSNSPHPPAQHSLFRNQSTGSIFIPIVRNMLSGQRAQNSRQQSRMHFIELCSRFFFAPFLAVRPCIQIQRRRRLSASRASASESVLPCLPAGRRCTTNDAVWCACCWLDAFMLLNALLHTVANFSGRSSYIGPGRWSSLGPIVVVVVVVGWDVCLCWWLIACWCCFLWRRDLDIGSGDLHHAIHLLLDWILLHCYRQRPRRRLTRWNELSNKIIKGCNWAGHQDAIRLIMAVW